MVAIMNFKGFLCLLTMCVAADGRHTTTTSDLSTGEAEFKVTGLVGEKVDLPCNVDVGSCGDVYFVTWTKNVSNEWKRLYLYSEPVEKPLQELANPDRADFFVHDSTAYLRISPLKIEDEGNYKCDVTYVQGKCPSLSYAFLKAVAKPTLPVIKKNGKKIETSTAIGPFYEGDSFSLQCLTFGGKPTPEVSWLKNDDIISVQPTVLNNDLGIANVTATVRIILSRSDLGIRLSCQVKSEAVEDILVSWIEVDLHVTPLYMKVGGPTKPIIEGEKILLSCTIVGAKPAANATWYNRSETIQPQPLSDVKLASDGSFKTISNLEIIVSRYDHQGVFYCKGSNPVVEKNRDPPLLKSISLNVLYPPIVLMEPRSGITINETEDATVGCTFDANPSEVSDVIWYKDRVQLSVEDKDKFRLKNSGELTLVIRNVTRSDSGLYSCTLSNKVGRGSPDKHIEINVVYPPVVDISISPTFINENDGSTVSMRCLTVDGNPRNLLRVRWYKNEQFMNETVEDRMEVENVSREATADYTCEAENLAGWGDRSESQKLIVNYLPGPAKVVEITSPAVKGRRSTLQCIVEDLGSPKATQFHWKHSIEVLPDIFQNYTTDPVGLDTQGNYTCSAVNNVGRGPSGYINLAAMAPPSLIDSLPRVHGAPSDSSSVSISCRIECDPLCEIEWLRDGESIMDSDLFFVKTTVHPEELRSNRFKSVVSTLHWNFTAWPGAALSRNTDNANYTCQSSKTIIGPGVATTTFFKVEYPPENITMSTFHLDVVEGEVPDKIKCTADSWPPSEYIWKFSNLVIADTSELFLNYSIPRERAGWYKCVASNRHGQKSIETYINVMYKPECILYERKNNKKQTTLVCEVQANPSTVNFTWMKENQTFEELVVSRGTRSIMTVPGNTPKYLGTYHCIANNSVGESVPCSFEVTGVIGTAGWVPDFGDENVIIVAAVVAAVVVVFIIVVLVVIMVVKRRRMRTGAKGVMKERKISEGRVQSTETTSLPNSNILPSFISNGSPSMRGGNSDTNSPSKRKTSYQSTENGQTGFEKRYRPMYENMVFSQIFPRGPNKTPIPAVRMRTKLSEDLVHVYENIPRSVASLTSPAISTGNGTLPSRLQVHNRSSHHRSTTNTLNNPPTKTVSNPNIPSSTGVTNESQNEIQNGVSASADSQNTVKAPAACNTSVAETTNTKTATTNTNESLVYADLSLPNSERLPTFRREAPTEYATLKFNIREEGFSDGSVPVSSARLQ
ncbi:hemicentin-1-like isoform X2 [Limulus polyphemus]|uniref:Hemicentin-1-like isoform X2 n=1 Tax=Limulus polyphemus TaxID=6850 RepID=A0ABM1TSF2_LIMPO|nr:hemicentin-1-like isoform X2 [Limulus polyphemus]